MAVNYEPIFTEGKAISAADLNQLVVKSEMDAALAGKQPKGNYATIDSNNVILQNAYLADSANSMVGIRWKIYEKSEALYFSYNNDIKMKLESNGMLTVCGGFNITSGSIY